MNSSGIKRGLAASAVGALAVAGIPVLATSASAAPGDVIQVQSTSNARNAGTEGALVVLNTTGVVAADLELASTTLNANEDSGTQSVEIISATLIPSGTTNDTTKNDGLDQIVVRVAVTTPNAGDTATFVIYEDEDQTGTDTANTPIDERVEDGVDAGEARAQASVQTAGNPTAVDVTPSTQTAPVGQASAPYTVTIRDAAGRVTQLTTGEELEVSATGGTTTFGGTAADGTISSTELANGTAEFTATGTTDTGLRTITVGDTDDANVSGSDTATLDVVRAAGLTVPELDVVTGADSWTGFGDVDADGSADPDSPTAVRVDQDTIRFDIRSIDANNDGTPDDANSTVTLTVNAADGELTFGGKDTITVSTTLDSSGRGSITITPDAGTVQTGDDFQVTGAGLPALDFQFQRAVLDATSLRVPNSVYSATDGTVTITATALDQFGLPVQGAQIDAQRLGANNANVDATAQPRKTTNANGEATFTFTDVNANPGQTDTVVFRLFEDQFDATANDTESTTIRYTQDGQGPDFITTLDGQNTEGSAYNPNSVSIVPLSDGDADDDTAPGDEIAKLVVNGGENGAPVTVTVDNGAVILTGAEDELAEGSASETGTVGQTFNIVGTKSGLVTATVTTGNRTETAQFTVQAQKDTSAARNVTVDGPADAEPGERVTFNAVITDAFGNPVPGVDASALNVQVSGPGALQDRSATTGADGTIALNVRIDEDAADGSVVTVRVEGISGWYQFGAAADQENVREPVGNASGLAASANVATDTVTVAADEAAVVASATIASSPEGEVPVGTAVTETVTVLDAAGNPVEGVEVRFTQNGPSSVDERVGTTNEAGKAFFVVTSAEPGTAFITAVVPTDGEPIVLEDEVVYTGGRVDIDPNLKQRNVSRSQKGMDWTKVGANAAKGAKVRLFQVMDNGTRKLVREGNISDKGQKIWILPDRNRRAERTFYAVVFETDQNNRAKTNRSTIN